MAILFGQYACWQCCRVRLFVGAGNAVRIPIVGLQRNAIQSQWPHLPVVCLLLGSIRRSVDQGYLSAYGEIDFEASQ